MRSKLVLALLASSFVFAVPRGWCASGDLDSSFGNNGAATASFSGLISFASAVVRQSDGKLVAAGDAAAAAGAQTVIAVARFDASGALDAGFGTGGTVTTDVGAFDDYAMQVLIQSDGKIVVVAQTETADDGSAVDIALIRYTSSGALDGTFGTGGVATVSLGSGLSKPYAGALQADDKIIVVGGTDLASTNDEFIARFDGAGALDGTFGTGGLVTLDFGGRGDAGRAVIVQPDGYIVAAGTSFNGPLFNNGAVATLTRVDSLGNPDATFGTGGSVIQSGPNVTLFNSLVRQSDGKLVTFGASGTGFGIAFRLFRYDAAGVHEGSFSPPSFAWMTPVSSGQVALGGSGEFAMIGDYCTVTRATSAGATDTDFGASGAVSLGFGGTRNAIATLIEPSGDIIVAGSSYANFDPHAAVMTLFRVLGSSPACTLDSDCSACERCGTSGFCISGSRTGCVVASSGGAGLKIKNKSFFGKSKLSLKWGGSVPSFDPTASDDVGICVYHYGRRILKSVAPADGTWVGSAPVFTYLDKTGTPDGVRKMAATSALIKGSATGPGLDATSQGVPNTAALGPLGDPVIMQLHLGGNACVEATFTANRRAKGSSFTGKSD